MVSKDEKEVISQYSGLYERIIPKHNKLRQINELIDFGFIYEEVKTKYSLSLGRPAESPMRLFKYLLLKVIYNMSDVGIVERSQYDMSFKYFLGMAPEAEVIDASTLTKFRKLRLQDADLLNLLIGKTVQLAIEKGIIKSKSIIVDATHTLSKSNSWNTIEVLRKRSKELRKQMYAHDEKAKAEMPEKPEGQELSKEIEYTKKLINLVQGKEAVMLIPVLGEKLALLEETVADIEENINLTKDKEAKIGYKEKDEPFFGYKTHIAMTEERLITAAVITSGEKNDGKELPQLLEISQKNGIEVDTIIGDAAYASKKNIELAEQADIKMVARLNPSVSQGMRKAEDEFEYNKDAGLFVCPAGHLATRKAKQGKKNVSKNQAEVHYFDVEKCKICPLRDGCYKAGAKSKTYSIRIKNELSSAQIEFEKSDYFKEKSKERYKIEAKNAELKNVHGYNRAHSYGLLNMQMQGALTIFAVNLKRIIKLTDLE